MSDSSNNIRIKLRTKLNTEVSDYSQLNEREIVAGDIEKSLFYRAHDSSNLYRYSPTDDDSTSVYRNWSANKIISELGNKADINHYHEYSDISGTPTFSPKNSILFTAGGAGTMDTSTAGTPSVVTYSGNQYWASSFTAINQRLFWSFPGPVDYNSLLDGIQIFYEAPTATVLQWRIRFFNAVNGVSLSSPTTPSNYSRTIDSTSSGAGLITVGDYVGTNYDLLPTSPALCRVELRLNSSTNFPVLFFGMRVNYLASIGYTI